MRDFGFKSVKVKGSPGHSEMSPPFYDVRIGWVRNTEDKSPQGYNKVYQMKKGEHNVIITIDNKLYTLLEIVNHSQ